MASEWVSIKEAAERLGISADTVRRRLKRGELAGRHEPTAQGFTWAVELPTLSPGAGDASVPLEPHGAAPATQAAVGEALELAELRERVLGLDRLTAELREERDEWREQARRHEDAARELRILVRTAQELGRALSATTPDAAASRQNGPGREDGPLQGVDTLQPADRSWWRRLLGLN